MAILTIKRTLMTIRTLVLAVLLLGSIELCHASSEKQQPAQIQKAVEDLVRQQTAGLPGKVSFTVGAMDHLRSGLGKNSDRRCRRSKWLGARPLDRTRRSGNTGGRSGPTSRGNRHRAKPGSRPHRHHQRWSRTATATGLVALTPCYPTGAVGNPALARQRIQGKRRRQGRDECRRGPNCASAHIVGTHHQRYCPPWWDSRSRTIAMSRARACPSILRRSAGTPQHCVDDQKM